MALGSSHTESTRAPPRTATPAARAAADAPARRSSRARVREIDVLKGLAIVGVMMQHAFSSSWLYHTWDVLYAGQAVPVFFVLMGLNATNSLARGRATSLRGLYTPRYVSGRFRRLVVPILIIWPLVVVVALAAGEFHIGPTVLIGVLPISRAPGNYFITIILEFAVVFPALFWCFERARMLTTLAVVALDVGFELLAPHVHVLGASGPANGYIYEACILKYGCAIVAGMWMSRLTIGRRRFTGVTVLAALSFAYLVWLHQDPYDFTSWLVNSFSISTNFLSVFYAIWLTYVGLRVLSPRPPRPLYGALEWTGRASYHVFLVQILWFGAIANRSWPVAVIGIIVSSAIGIVFFALTERGVHRPIAHGRVRPGRA